MKNIIVVEWPSKKAHKCSIEEGALITRHTRVKSNQGVNLSVSSLYYDENGGMVENTYVGVICKDRKT
jgi:hypothetical protein|tara:strand:- start:4226 stop:4429 length:204 start_codon:yes stop_codon:yes gene_type:complete